MLWLFALIIVSAHCAENANANVSKIIDRQIERYHQSLEFRLLIKYIISNEIKDQMIQSIESNEITKNMQQSIDKYKQRIDDSIEIAKHRINIITSEHNQQMTNKTQIINESEKRIVSLEYDIRRMEIVILIIAIIMALMMRNIIYLS